MSLTIADAAIAIGADFSDGAFKAQVNKGVTTELAAAGKTGSAAMGKEMVAGGTAAGHGMGAAIQTALNPKNLLAGVGMGIGLEVFGQAKQLITNFVAGSAAAYREMQTSIVNLNGALQANVKNWDGNTAAIEKTIAAQMRLGFDDEEMRNSLARLVGVTKDVAAAQMLQVAAIELARVKSISLGDATQILVMASTGMMRGLKQIGITMAAGASATEIYAAVMKVAGTRAEDFANTSEGRLLYSQIKVKEAMEKVGAAMDWVSNTAIPPLSDGVTMIADGLETLATNANIVVPIAGLIAAAWVSGLGAMTTGFGRAVLAGIKGSALIAVPAGTAEGAAIGGATVAGEGAVIAAGGPVVAAGVAASGGAGIAAGGAVGTAIGGAIGAAMALAIPVLVVGSLAMLAPTIRDFLDKNLNVRAALFGPQDSKTLTDGLPWPFGPKGTPDFSIGPLEHMLGGDSVPKAAAKTAEKVTKTFEQAALDIKLLAAGIPQAIIDELDAGKSTLEMGADGAFKAVPIALDNAALAAEAIAAGAPQDIADQIAAGKGTLSVAADGTFSVIPATADKAAAKTVVSFQTMLSDLVSTIKGGRTALSSAISDAMDATIRPGELKRQEKDVVTQIAALQKKIAAGSQSTANLQHNLNVEALAELTKQHLALLAEDAKYGTAAERKAKLTGLLQSQYLLDGLKSKDPDTAAMWLAYQAKTQTALDMLNGIMGTEGKNAGDALYKALAAALIAGLPEVQKAAWDLMNASSGKGAGGAAPQPGQTWQAPTPKPYASGTPYVAYDQFAYIHKGEAIIPAAQNAAGLGGLTVNLGGVTIGAGADVSLGAAKRFGQTILDEVAKGLQQQGSRYSEFSGSRP